MCELQHNTEEWDYSKTQTLVVMLKTPNRRREEFYVSLEVEHSFPQVGCVRKRLQSYTVLLIMKFFLQLQVCAWMVYPLSISGLGC